MTRRGKHTFSELRLYPHPFHDAIGVCRDRYYKPGGKPYPEHLTHRIGSYRWVKHEEGGKFEYLTANQWAVWRHHHTPAS